MLEPKLHLSNTPFDAKIYQQRRQQLIERIRQQGGGLALLTTAPVQQRNHGNDYPYRYDSNFHYLSGFPEPEAAIILLVSEQSTQAILFCRDKNPEREIWEGFRYGPQRAQERFLFDQSYSIEQLNLFLREHLSQHKICWYSSATQDTWLAEIPKLFTDIRQKQRSEIAAPQQLNYLDPLIHQMRLIKDHQEIAIMRQAGKISALAHIQAMKTCQPGQYEYQVEAQILHVFFQNGSRFPAYSNIVASGANACILHYIENNKQILSGDLVLIDAGCELDGYAGDISRTFPANGKFTSAQAKIYDLVLSAHEASAQLSKPGTPWNFLHEAATKTLTQGFIDLGLIHEPFDEAMEKQSFRRFYMHNTGHWLGKDVHDVGEYTLNNQAQILQPGMVFTIEPGCYIPAEQDIPQEFHNIGIRIEDNYLITESSHEVLTQDVPLLRQDIENIMRKP